MATVLSITRALITNYCIYLTISLYIVNNNNVNLLKHFY